MNHFIKSSRKKRRVLVVDDEMINRELLEAILAFNYEVDSASNGKEAMDILYAAKQPYSLILLDLLMPKMSGFQVLEACKSDEALKKIPIIVMTSEKSAEVRSIRLGADDFITKPYRMPEVILARCERIVELSEEKSLIRSIEKDKETGLYTKDFFYAYIRRIPETRFDTDAIVLRFGGMVALRRCCGDEGVSDLLRSAAELVKSELLGTKGIAGHINSGEFFIFCKHKEDYEVRLGNIVEALRREAGSESVTLCAGIYERVDRTAQPEHWFERAEAACDTVDLSTGNRIAKFTDEMLKRDLMIEELRDEIGEALEKGQFELRYRPRYSTAEGKTQPVAVEAELCWQHPKYGAIGHTELIPLLKRHPLGCEVMRFMATEAADKARRWMDSRGDIPVVLPLFCADCSDPDAPVLIEGIARRVSLPIRMLIPVIDCDSSFTGIIRAFGERGFEVELNGFGAGGMSLRELSGLPATALRPDASLTRGMLGGAEAKNALANALKIAAVLNKKTVVRGVENSAQLELLKELGCDLVSGDALSRAMTAEEFIRGGI